MVVVEHRESILIALAEISIIEKIPGLYVPPAGMAGSAGLVKCKIAT